MLKYFCFFTFSFFINCNEIVDIKKRPTREGAVIYTITYANRNMVTIGRFKAGNHSLYTTFNTSITGQSTATDLNEKQGRGHFEHFEKLYDVWQHNKALNNNNSN
jgi:hypothetical protein